MKLTLKHAIAAIVLALSFVAPARSQIDVMQFVAYPPDPLVQKLMNDYRWTIFATGEIDAAADKRLATLIAEKNIPSISRLYLHSIGGSLVGGMALGRVIREHKLQTLIGQFDPTADMKLYKGIKPGYCYSACATAFLGGEYRYWTNGSIFGVHRFYWDKRSDRDADLAQMVSAAVVEYIRSMDVDTKIFSLASQAGSSEMITPSHETLLELNVVNDGRKRAKWTIESIEQGIYLKGEQETADGMNKFMIACPGTDPIYLYAIFEGGRNAEETISFPVNWLFLNGEQVRIDEQLIGKKIINGKINLEYQLDGTLLAAISRANFVGVGLQPTAAAAFFAGFNHMPFAEGAAKLPGLLVVCHHGKR
jgi:hypothetical protein